MPAPTPGVTYDLEAVTRRHGRGPGAVLANDQISLRVRSGEVFGLLGPNGAGKTTLVRAMVGLLVPDSGRVRLYGRDVAGQPRLVAGFTAYLPQETAALDDLPVGLAIETTARLRGASRADARTERAALLDELDLAGIAGRALARLSGGQRRMAALATALAGERRVLVLDEPTTGLDPEARTRVWGALDRRRRESGATVVLVTHNVLEAETVLDRVAILDRGRLVACDTPGRLKAGLTTDVRLDLVWRGEPPETLEVVRNLRAHSVVNGSRWRARLAPEQARTALAELTGGPALAVLDDFTLATPTLEDVYLQLGHPADLDRT